jgi:hypothetical protein
MSRFLRYWPLLLLLGGGGLLLVLVLEVLRGDRSVRRLVAMGVGGFLAAAFMAMAAGNIGLRFTEPGRPEPAYTAAGVVFLVTLTAAAIGLLVAYRRQRATARQASQAPASTSTPASTSPTTSAGASQPVVVVQGAPPKAAAALERELQAVAALVRAPLVIQVAPRCPVRGRRLEGGILLQVPRPRVDLVLDALEMALQGAQVLPCAAGGASSFFQARREEGKGEKAGEAMAVTTTSNKKKRPRPEDLAAALGGQGPAEQ